MTPSKEEDQKVQAAKEAARIHFQQVEEQQRMEAMQWAERRLAQLKGELKSIQLMPCSIRRTATDATFSHHALKLWCEVLPCSEKESVSICSADVPKIFAMVMACDI